MDYVQAMSLAQDLRHPTKDGEVQMCNSSRPPKGTLCHHIPLDTETSKLCTTIFLWGKCHYLHLPMGIATSPDAFQKAMNDAFGDLDCVLVHLDDILILSNHEDSFEDHLAKVNEVFSRPHKMGMKVNLHKTEFFQDTLDHLGCTLTPHGIEPQTKKVEEITDILPPANRKQR